MKVLYVTNKLVEDKNVIPNIIRKSGDQVIIKFDRFDLNFLIDYQIEFIVCDRPKFLLKDDILQYLPNKVINIHPSFLPWNKGYFPNYWSAKTKTPHGTTIHFIDSGIDTGKIIAQTRMSFLENDTLKTSYLRLRKLSVDLFYSIWPDVRKGEVIGFEQSQKKGILYYRKDFDGILDSLPNGWDTKLDEI